MTSFTSIQGAFPLFSMSRHLSVIVSWQDHITKRTPERGSRKLKKSQCMDILINVAPGKNNSLNLT